MKIELDLDTVEVGKWGDTVEGIIREELTNCIRRRVQGMLRGNPALNAYMEKVQKQVLDKFTEELLQAKRNQA